MTPRSSRSFRRSSPLTIDQIRNIATIKNDKKRLITARKAILKLYDKKEDELGADLLRGAEREIYMQVLDVLWMQTPRKHAASTRGHPLAQYWVSAIH